MYTATVTTSMGSNSYANEQKYKQGRHDESTR